MSASHGRQRGPRGTGALPRQFSFL